MLVAALTLPTLACGTDTSNGSDSGEAGLNHAPLGIPIISGNAVVGEVLKADTSTISDADGLGAFSYQWKRGTTPTGTDSATYTLVSADIGHELTVEVTYTDRLGTAEGPLVSAPTAQIRSSPAAPTFATVVLPEIQVGEGYSGIDLDDALSDADGNPFIGL